MKNEIGNRNKHIGLTMIFFTAALALLFGCGTPKQDSDPLEGWKGIGGLSFSADGLRANLGNGHDINEIMDDVNKFIETLPPDQRGANLGPFQLYEDGTGQHAVGFEVFVGPYTSWHYALFYDKENKRANVIKYGKTRRMS